MVGSSGAYARLHSLHPFTSANQRELLYPESADSFLQCGLLGSRQAHEARLDLIVPNDTVVRVVIDGKDGIHWDMEQHNARQPNFLHVVGPVRVWVARHAKAPKAS